MSRIITMEPAKHSPDIVASHVDQLRAVFPEVFAEGRVNFDVLKQLLGEAVDESDERYGLNWHGKRHARQLALTPSVGTLRPCIDESLDWNTTRNMVIEGDNLEVLKLMQRSYAGKINIIYIDPPYNTGNDFVYSDDYRDNLRRYLQVTGQRSNDNERISSNTESSGRFHTNWLNMIYPRLKVARELLSLDGLIFISIDENELVRLCSVCDELFGEENFLSITTWKRKKESANDGRGFAVKGEFIVIYRRSTQGFPKRLPLSESYLKSSYKAPTERYPNDRWRPVPITTTKGHQSGGYSYSVTTPKGTKITRSWLYPRKGFDKLLARGRIYWGQNDDRLPQRVMYANESKGTLPDNVWTDIATNKEGKKEVTDLLGSDVFDTIKPTNLLRHILSVGGSKDCTVLDFFAGSGTTGHAVMSQNAADGGDRRYILVQIPLPLDPTQKRQKNAAKYCDQLGVPRNIAELTKVRLQLAASKLQSKTSGSSHDFGYRVFKLESSNIRKWDPAPSDLVSALLANVDHIKSERSKMDILYEILLKLGLDLCTPLKDRRIAQKTIYLIGNGTLIACLDATISIEDVESLAHSIVDWHRDVTPDRDTSVIFRDSAFVNDIAKANLIAILEQHGLTDVRCL